MGNDIVVLTIEELQERWGLLVWMYGIDKLIINEDFPKRGKHSYRVDLLKMEFEKDYVMCDDYYHNIINHDSPLMFFLKQSILSIKLIPITNGYQERLEFAENGVILIEKAS